MQKETLPNNRARAGLAPLLAQKSLCVDSGLLGAREDAAVATEPGGGGVEKIKVIN